MTEKYYGLKIGDIVEYRTPGGFIVGEVVHLAFLDNNGGTIKTKYGPMRIICERCKVIKSVNETEEYREARCGNLFTYAEDLYFKYQDNGRIIVKSDKDLYNTIIDEINDDKLLNEKQVRERMNKHFNGGKKMKEKIEETKIEETKIEEVSPRLQQLIQQHIAVSENLKVLKSEKDGISAEIKLIMRTEGRERLEDIRGNLVTYKEQTRTNLSNAIALKELGEDRFKELATESSFTTLKILSSESRKKIIKK